MISPYLPIREYKGAMRKRNAPPPSLTFSRARDTLRLASAVILLLAIVPALGAIERTIELGGDERWELVAHRERLVLEPGRGGYLDVSLEAFRHEPGPSTELLLGFDALPLRDAARHYAVRVPSAGTADGWSDDTASSAGSGHATPELSRVTRRTGSGALLVDGPEDRLEIVPGPDSSFAPGLEWASFTIDFWFYPVVLEDGDTILAWRAREGAARDFRPQELAIEVDRGVIVARFDNFFVRPNDSGVIVELRGGDRLIPRTWSHHLVRFDAATGLLEYLVDGRPVDIVYVSSTGRQDGSVFFPRIASHPGEGLSLAEGIVGAIDELRIERRFVEDTDVPLLPPGGGELVTDFIDLGAPGARLTAVDARFDAPGLSDVFLYYRMTNLRGTLQPAESAWTPVPAGEPILDATGRFVQLRAELFPDTRSGTAPRLSRVAISYEPDPAPLPPTALRAVPRDGAVALEWAGVQEPDIEGYLVYYGDRPGRYFGTDSDLGASPIDVGPATAVTIDGLENGALYYFAVQAYSRRPANRMLDTHSGELSAEVAARPARVYR